MTTFIISGESTTAQTLVSFESGLVAATGSLQVFGSPAVFMDGPGFLNVLGVVYSSVLGVNTTAGGFISVGATGVLTGNFGGITLTGLGNNSTVNNKGLIFGGTGISIVDASANVTNAGQIIGDSGAALQLSGGGTLRLTNSGDISGNNTGVQSTGTSVTIIGNTGLIAGGVNGLSLSNGVSQVTNSGLIDGRVLLGGGADVFNGTSGVQGNVFGGSGTDRMSGGIGEEGLFGGNDGDTLRGNGGDDVLDGGDGNDLLFGGTEDDTLTGGIGLDTLHGGLGDDRLTGGTLADTFVFTRNQGTDTITDFANTVDKLDLRAFDLGSLAAVTALASPSAFGLRIDLPGEGMIFVTGLTLAQLDATDLLL